LLVMHALSLQKNRIDIGSFNPHVTEKVLI
jgi:hypothetical protein